MVKSMDINMIDFAGWRSDGQQTEYKLDRANIYRFIGIYEIAVPPNDIQSTPDLDTFITANHANSLDIPCWYNDDTQVLRLEYAPPSNVYFVVVYQNLDALQDWITRHYELLTDARLLVSNKLMPYAILSALEKVPQGNWTTPVFSKVWRDVIHAKSRD